MCVARTSQRHGEGVPTPRRRSMSALLIPTPSTTLLLISATLLRRPHLRACWLRRGLRRGSGCRLMHLGRRFGRPVAAAAPPARGRAISGGRAAAPGGGSAAAGSAAAVRPAARRPPGAPDRPPLLVRPLVAATYRHRRSSALPAVPQPAAPAARARGVTAGGATAGWPGPRSAPCPVARPGSLPTPCPGARPGRPGRLSGRRPLSGAPLLSIGIDRPAPLARPPVVHRSAPLRRQRPFGRRSRPALRGRHLPGSTWHVSAVALATSSLRSRPAPMGGR